LIANPTSVPSPVVVLDLKEVAVVVVALMVPTVILGVPESPVALPVTLPVKAPENVVAVTTPEALRLVAPMVPTVMLGVPESPVALPVTFPTKPPVDVVTPVTLRLLNVEVPDVLIPAIPPPPDAVTVTIPADTADTVKLSPKSMVPAVPTSVPLSLTITPEPEATTPVSAEPSPTNEVAVTTPETFNCLANNVVPVTVVIPAKVETPVTFRLVNVEVPVVSIPAILLLPPVAVIDTVAIPEEKVAVTPAPTKLIVPAVPMVVPSSLITIPVPEATTPVSAEPSPTNEVAVTTPVTFNPLLVTVVRPATVNFLPTVASVLIATVIVSRLIVVAAPIVGIPPDVLWN